MANIPLIISLIDSYLESKGLDRVEANEASIYLEKNGVIRHSDGKPLRKLLRAGMIPSAEQPGGKNTSWYIRHSGRKNPQPTPVKPVAPKIAVSKTSTSATNTNDLAPVADSESEILILGTLPGKVSLQTQQYYANRGNQLWAIISRLFNERMPLTYTDKLQLLKKHHIALWDVLKSADRDSSLDTDIKNPIANDISGFISKHPKLRIIGLNGNKAHSFFRTFVDAEKIPGHISVIPLTSTSSTNTRFTLAEKTELWRALKRKNHEAD